MKKTITICWTIINLFIFSYTNAQSKKVSYLGQTDWEVVAKAVKKKFIYESSKLKKFDSSYQINKNKYYTFNNLSEENVCLQLLSYEQDFSNYDTLFISNYIILLSIYKNEVTGHGVKYIETVNFLLTVSCEESFSQIDLNHYLLAHKQQLKYCFYNNLNCWRNFKSFKRKLNLDKLEPLRLL
ncbi:hypothetical protein [Hydrotalea sandarakina]|jgi:hypothetical protein|uniref:Uncharacterized protein n=1 Tax=Hydrotalea sandarakina TaxID=1004304 RepID=A0A2W7TSH9_9BACT|nr:hypothetical protein [Hydrotalea sandarakina]PZX66072.1 hypothetical protein LX80_00572 [Hydrotalea sandarakina]